MERVRIVTNAVCDLEPAVAEANEVVMIPEAIVFDDEVLLSNVDFDQPTLFKRLREAKKFPTGSHPNVSMYMEAFKSLEGTCSDIIMLNMTGRMSGSFNTACIAKNTLEQEGFCGKIYVVDTLGLSYGLGFLVLEAAKMAREGAAAQQIVDRVEQLKGQIGIYFCMPTLEYAKKGGRLGAIKTFLADSLNIKPVLNFRDGTVSDCKTVYTFKQALRMLSVYYEQRAKKGGHVVIFHGDNLKDAEGVAERVRAIDPEANVEILWLGSAIGIYTGPGAVGVTFWE